MATGGTSSSPGAFNFGDLFLISLVYHAVKRLQPLPERKNSANK